MSLRAILLGVFLLVVLIPVGIYAMSYLKTKPLSEAMVKAAYDTPLAPLEGPISVYHLGHSLVGRDMPAMLAQLVGEEYQFAEQLGWGTSLREHFEPEVPINGFKTENDHDAYRDAREALASGDYNVFVLTEMVELRDAIAYHDSAAYLQKWEDLARAGNPDIRIYLYETWHPLDDPAGWLHRLDTDLKSLWEDQVLSPGRGEDFVDRPTYVIPGGQVMANFVRKVDTAGGIGNVKSREDLFQKTEDGALDPIHFNDLGAYLMALTHYAVIFGRSPVGLPFALNRADGKPADAPSEAAARAMQDSVWEVVTNYRKTGVAP